MLKNSDSLAGNGQGKPYKVPDFEGMSRADLMHEIEDLAGRFNSQIDTTGIDEIKNQLHKKTQELQLIFDNVPVRIWYKDDKNRILKLNKVAADSMGMRVEDAEGQDTYDLCPEIAEKYHKDDLEVMHSGKAKLDIIEEYIPKDGERGWVRTDKVPYEDPDTGERTIFVVAQDITERKNTELDLKKYMKDLE